MLPQVAHLKPVQKVRTEIVDPLSVNQRRGMNRTIAGRQRRRAIHADRQIRNGASGLERLARVPQEIHEDLIGGAEVVIEAQREVVVG